MKIDLSRFRIDKLTCQVNEKPERRALQITVRAHVPDVVTGQPTDIYNMRTIPIEAVEMSPGLLQHEIRAGLLQALEHELDECLFVNGKRLRDPHPVELGGMVRLPDGSTGCVSAVKTVDEGYRAKVGKTWFAETELVVL